MEYIGILFVFLLFLGAIYLLSYLNNFWATIVFVLCTLIPIVGFLPGPSWIRDYLMQLDILTFSSSFAFMFLFLPLMYSSYLFLLYVPLYIWLYKKTAKRYRYKLVLLLINCTFMAAPYQFPFSKGGLIRFTRPPVIERGKVCIEAIEAYKIKHGVYPAKIADVGVELNMNRIVNPWIFYKRKGDSYSFNIQESLLGAEMHIYTVYKNKGAGQMAGNPIKGYPDWLLGVTPD